MGDMNNIINKDTLKIYIAFTALQTKNLRSYAHKTCTQINDK